MVYDVAIIGAGPGGYVAAIRAAQLGAEVALIENNKLGGTCLNRGCIPTKAVLASVHILEQVKTAKKFGISVQEVGFDYAAILERQRKSVKQLADGLEKLLKTYPQIEIIRGEPEIISQDKIAIDSREIEFKNLVIATGSNCAQLRDIEVDHSFIINSDDALELETLPSKLVIIGGGAIGIEWARIYSAFGVDVTIIEMLDQLVPACDKEVSDYILRLFKRNKVVVKTGVRVEGVLKSDNKVEISLNNGESILADKVLMAAGRVPNLDVKGLERLALQLNGRHLYVDSLMRTNVAHVYAVGDVTGILQLAHVASHQAVVAVEDMLGHKPEPINYSIVPFCIYGQPEIASVGVTEDQAKSLALQTEVNKFYYGANGKAVAESVSDGFVKTIIDCNNKKIIGVHAIGAAASDIVHSGVIAIAKGLTKDDFKDMIFAHPTLSETFYESVTGLHSAFKVPVVNK